MKDIRVIRRLARPLLVLPFLIGSLAPGLAPAGAAEDDAGGSGASAAEVAAGLRTIRSAAEGIAEAAEGDNARADQLLDTIEPAWEKIESTVKANDKDRYLELEESFTLLKIGVRAEDAAKAATASEALTGVVAGYLEKYPAADEPEVEAEAPAGRSAAAAETSGTGSPLPRTGPASVPVLTGGMALALGGLATIGGSRRSRRASPGA